MNSTANDIPTDFKSTLPPRKRARTKEEKEQRRIERILRNRKAAHQSREKKRLHLQFLEQKCDVLEKLFAKVGNLDAIVGADEPLLAEYQELVHASSQLDSPMPQSSVSPAGSSMELFQPSAEEKQGTISPPSTVMSRASSIGNEAAVAMDDSGVDLQLISLIESEKATALNSTSLNTWDLQLTKEATGNRDLLSFVDDAEDFILSGNDDTIDHLPLIKQEFKEDDDSVYVEEFNNSRSQRSFLSMNDDIHELDDWHNTAVLFKPIV